MIIILRNEITKKLGLTVFSEFPKETIYFFEKANHCTMLNMNFDIFLTFVDENFKILEEIEAKIGKSYINTKAFGFIESENQISPKELYKLKQKYETIRP